MVDAYRIDTMDWGSSLEDYMMYRRLVSSLLEAWMAVEDGETEGLSDRARVLLTYTQDTMDYIGILGKLEKVLAYVEMDYGIKLLNDCADYSSKLESGVKEYCVELPRELEDLSKIFGFEVSAGQIENPHSQIEQYLLEDKLEGEIEFREDGYGSTILATDSLDVARAYVALYMERNPQED